MNLNECYRAMDADYDDVMRRLATEERVTKFLFRTIEDNSVTVLVSAMETEDYETAFRAAHTIKGLSLNMGLTRLAYSSGRLTENLREGQINPDTEGLLEEVKADYKIVVDAVARLKND